MDGNGRSIAWVHVDRTVLEMIGMGQAASLGVAMPDEASCMAQLMELLPALYPDGSAWGVVLGVTGTPWPAIDVA